MYSEQFEYKKIFLKVKNHIDWLENPKNYELNAQVIEIFKLVACFMIFLSTRLL